MGANKSNDKTLLNTLTVSWIENQAQLHNRKPESELYRADRAVSIDCR